MTPETGEPPTGAVLLERLAAAEETLRALSAGEVDALVMRGVNGERRVYTLETADILYRRLVERMTDGAVLLDMDGRVIYANDQLARMLGRGSEALLGHPLADWLEPQERDRFASQLHDSTRREGAREYLLRSDDGSFRPVLVGMGRIVEGDGRIHYLTVADLTDQKAHEARVNRLNKELGDRLGELRKVNADLNRTQQLLVHQAMHDPLTGLPNRNLFLNRLEQALADEVRGSRSTVVLFVDMDGFKRVNDVLGHSTGDRLLREVAARLTEATRPGDTVARFGGDEFLVLGPHIDDTSQAESLGQRLLEAMMTPFPSTHDQPVAASIGIALSDHAVTADQLVQQADVAMYRAKQDGGARLQVFGPQLREELRMRATNESQLRTALDHDGLQVHYQRVVDLRDNQPIGAEALVRIRQSDGSILQPASFISTAEETGLVLPLGRRVLAEACRQPLRWEAESRHRWYVSVNISPRQLKDTDLVGEVAADLRAAGLPGDRLRLEITESALIEVGPPVAEILNRLRGMGIQIGVDDFGTGYASMSYVRHLPLDFVKIDQSFVFGMLDDAHDMAMVEATLALARRLDLQSVAEGIETEAQASRLRELGCTEGQGFLFARPTPSNLICGSARQHDEARG